jgi:hypothetical protein
MFGLYPTSCEWRTFNVIVCLCVRRSYKLSLYPTYLTPYYWHNAKENLWCIRPERLCKRSIPNLVEDQNSDIQLLINRSI